MRNVVVRADSYGISIEDIVRYGSVASRLKEWREREGLSVKDVAQKLKLRQYKVRDAESGGGAVSGDVLMKYVSLAGLDEWYDAWRRQNPDLADRIARRPG